MASARERLQETTLTRTKPAVASPPRTASTAWNLAQSWTSALSAGFECVSDSSRRLSVVGRAFVVTGRMVGVASRGRPGVWDRGGPDFRCGPMAYVWRGGGP